MAQDEKENDIDLPKWYMRLEKGAGKLFMGCFSAEVILLFGAKYVIPEDVIKMMHAVIVPFGILCIILSGTKGLGYINDILETIKKIKENGK